MTAAAFESGQVMTAPAGAGRLYALFWRWHFLAALIVIPFVLWQSTTGTLYLWSEWWMDAHHPELRFVTASETEVPPSRQIVAAFATLDRGIGPQGAIEHRHGGHAGSAGGSPALPVLQILLSDDPHRSTVVLMQGPDELPYPIFVDPHTGAVLGSLGSGEWLPGISRALHAGWPAGKPGNWLLELGDCWAIVMLVSGLYLWWPRGRSIWMALRPRLHAGPRMLVRDLHATVAVIFAAVLLFFVVSALPWTAFWGGEVLSRFQAATGQESPAGFSTGGAGAAQISTAAASIDAVVADAGKRGVKGTMAIQLSPWPDAPLFLTNRTPFLRDDRIVTADASSGKITGDFRNEDLPIIPRLVAIGIHVHQGDFGPVNLWLNTLFAISLIWLSATGIVSWWIRRPKGRIGVPSARRAPWSVGMITAVVATAVLLPIFGLSIVVIATARRLARART